MDLHYHDRENTKFLETTHRAPMGSSLASYHKFKVMKMDTKYIRL